MTLFTPSVMTRCLAATALVAAASSVAASPFQNLPTDQDARVSVGANVMGTWSAYDTDNDVMVLPSLFYDNNRVYARGAQLGAYLINDGKNELSVYAQPMGTHFDPEDANGSLQGLDERDISAGAGVSYLRRTPIGGFRGQITTDVLGKNDGTTGRLTYLAKYDTDRLTVYPSVGLEWRNQDYNDYYYGVDSDESARSGTASYSPDSSIHPYVSVSANYEFNDKWSGFASQSLDYLSDEAYDSPMVDSRTEARTTLGVSYTF